MRVLIAAVALFVIAVLAGTTWTLRRALLPVDPHGAEQSFVVADGANLGSVAEQLQDAGLIHAAWAFEGMGRWRDAGADLRAGEYALSPALPPSDILDRLVRGSVLTYPVSIPEGLRADEIALRFEEAGFGTAEEFMALVRDPAFIAELGIEADSLEGYLFPETYRWARGLPLREQIKDMVEQFRSTWEPLAAAAAARNFSQRDTVILASIVEKETGASGERPLIAAVFHNRLGRGMRLETDPTVIYGIQDFDGNLRRVHLEDESNPYNTYRIPALPPGPIANPGAAALQAVVKPETSEALFFVSKNDGTHYFSRTYAEHVRAVDRYQRRGRRRSAAPKAPPTPAVEPAAPDRGTP